MCEEGKSAGSINQDPVAIGRVVREAADNDLVSEAAARVLSGKGIRQDGRQASNWLTHEQAQDLINAPTSTRLRDCATVPFWRC